MPRRSLHFVPGGQARMLEKALTLPADGLILDLEDAVPPERKAETRPIVRDWLQRFSFRELRPFFLAFIGLTIFDVLIQGYASRAFGVPISWAALTGRIPLVYVSFLIPTLGNFGTREVAWAALFAEFGPRDSLIAYAFSVNMVFLALNVLLGLTFLPRALALVAAVRWARRCSAS